MPDVNLNKYSKIAIFNSTLVENMEILSMMDNYYKWIGGIMREYTGEKVLEIGCGNGNLSSFFSDREIFVGSDYSKEYINMFNKRFKDKKNFRSFILDITDAKKILKLKRYKFDTIITMNTFEHIKDDILAFKNSYKILDDGGRFIILVPALMFLYSILDYEGGHYRRYTKKELASKLQSVGYRIEKIFYFNIAGAAGWYFNHVLLKKRVYSPNTFKLYNSLVPFFRFCESLISPPFGLSVICIAKKI